jgi:molybdenum cofactor cytidylyltransferase
VDDVAAIILAAGRATRFSPALEETKLAADYDGKPLVRHVADAALASAASLAFLITGHAREKVLAALAGLDIIAVHNDAYADGLSTSLRTGVAALPAHVAGAVILLGDMPLITSALIDRLIACFAAAPLKPDAVVPVRHGQWGNPVLLGRKLFSDIARLQGDRGAMALLKEEGRLILECEMEDRAIEIDVDTRETLERMKNAL